MSVRPSNKQLVLMCSLVLLVATTTLLWRDTTPRVRAWGEANAWLTTRSNMPALRAYFRCLNDARCRGLYSSITNISTPFPMAWAMVWLASIGGVAIGLFWRPKTTLYDGALATKHDVSDLRLANWLHNKRAHHGILIGHHVTVPEGGAERRPTLRGTRKGAIDARVMVLSRGYGKRRELTSLAVFGTSRSGKSLLLVAQILRWLGSGIYLDIKGELYRLTAGTKAQRGKVFVLSPHGQGHQFDPIAELMENDNGLSTAAEIIAAPHKEKGDSVYFADKAAQALTAAFQAARVEGVAPFDLLYDVVLEGGLGSFIERLWRHDDPAVRLSLNAFLDPYGGEDFDLQRALSDKGLAASYSTMTSRLGPFLKPGVRYLLRRSDFRASDLMDKRHNVYLQWPEITLENNLAVYDLVMTGLIRGMIRHVDITLQGSPPEVPVFVGLDEIYRAPLTHLPSDLSTATGRDIVIALYCQTIAQLRGVYGEDGKVTILDNCGVKLFYKTEGPETAKYISDLAHKVSRTEERRSKKWRVVPEMPVISEANQSREVITPDEVMLVGGKDRELLIAEVTGKPLMVAKRVDWRQEQGLLKLMKRYPAPKVKQPSEAELVLEPKEAPVNVAVEKGQKVKKEGETAQPRAAREDEVQVVQPENSAVHERIEKYAGEGERLGQLPPGEPPPAAEQPPANTLNKKRFTAGASQGEQGARGESGMSVLERIDASLEEELEKEEVSLEAAEKKPEAAQIPLDFGQPPSSKLTRAGCNSPTARKGDQRVP